MLPGILLPVLSMKVAMIFKSHGRVIKCLSSGLNSFSEFLFLISYPSLLLYYYYWDILFLIQSLCYNCRTCLQFCLYTSSDSAFQVLYIYQRFPKGGCLTPYLGTLHKVVVDAFSRYPEYSILCSRCPHCFIYSELFPFV